MQSSPPSQNRGPSSLPKSSMFPPSLPLQPSAMMSPRARMPIETLPEAFEASSPLMLFPKSPDKTPAEGGGDPGECVCLRVGHLQSCQLPSAAHICRCTLWRRNLDSIGGCRAEHHVCMCPDIVDESGNRTPPFGVCRSSLFHFCVCWRRGADPLNGSACRAAVHVCIRRGCGDGICKALSHRVSPPGRRPGRTFYGAPMSDKRFDRAMWVTDRLPLG